MVGVAVPPWEWREAGASEKSAFPSRAWERDYDFFAVNSKPGSQALLGSRGLCQAGLGAVNRVAPAWASRDEGKAPLWSPSSGQNPWFPSSGLGTRFGAKLCLASVHGRSCRSPLGMKGKPELQKKVRSPAELGNEIKKNGAFRPRPVCLAKAKAPTSCEPRSGRLGGRPRPGKWGSQRSRRWSRCEFQSGPCRCPACRRPPPGPGTCSRHRR